MRPVTMVLVCAAAALSTGCVGPRGHGVSDRRDYVQSMKQSTLDDFYVRRPELRSKVDQSVGYGVFSNVGFTAVFVGAGNGYGVVVDKGTGKETYMRMLAGSAGLGLGVKDVRLLLVFNSKSALDKFINHGWDFGAEGEASAKLSDKGGSAGMTGSITREAEAYELTENGISASATVGGTKFWWDDELN